ncbi:hypothetical protein SAMN05216302_10607 [Nitrosomonas aestuarii]|uniref:PAS domain S-box-containing protein n=1 Tax=Nitrosomonas aestuarii TaxID=52441 RepID=A0A1I4GPB6_9PROT|nr:hypothetical protein [Nitrosomonas aestuarii]SFL31874.1 hypothetical protein SAMN05216302_10607 [Nitrosomonas aestuarii]
MKAQSREMTTDDQEQWHVNVNRHRDTPAILMLSGDGIILNTNKEGAALLGYSEHSSKLHVSKVIPQLTKIDLLEDGNRVNSYLRFLSRIGRRFEVIGLNGTRFMGELYFNDIKVSYKHQIIVMIFPVYHDSKKSAHLII